MNKFKNGKNKNNNFVTTFKLDADIEDFFRNIDKVTFIESMKKGNIRSFRSFTQTEFINSLIRSYMYKMLGITTDNQEIIDYVWKQYKKANGLGD